MSKSLHWKSSFSFSAFYMPMVGWTLGKNCLSVQFWKPKRFWVKSCLACMFLQQTVMKSSWALSNSSTCCPNSANDLYPPVSSIFLTLKTPRLWYLKDVGVWGYEWNWFYFEKGDFLLIYIDSWSFSILNLRPKVKLLSTYSTLFKC